MLTRWEDKYTSASPKFQIVELYNNNGSQATFGFMSDDVDKVKFIMMISMTMFKTSQSS